MTVREPLTKRFKSLVALAYALAAPAAQVTDTHFHACPFGESDQCVALSEMLPVMDESGVETVWVFGLQHQLVSNPGDIGHWPAQAACAPVEPMILPGSFDESQPSIEQCQEIHAQLGGERPFHYNDPCAKPGWPVAPNRRADEWIFGQHAGLSDEAKGRIKPFLSYLNFGDPCARSPEGGSANLAYVKSMDEKYPRSIFGFAEHNLNKLALYSHNSCKPSLDGWRRCSRRLMNYIARSNRPIGVHLDIMDIRGRSYKRTLLSFGSRYRRNVIIWMHGGIAPEVTNRLSAEEHIAMMEAFLATSPGRRYIELSWPDGFYRRLNEEALSTDQRGWPIERDFEAEKQLYADFLSKHRDELLFGSDQVSLGYDELRVDGVLVHAAYDDDYRKTLDQQNQALRMLIDTSTPDGEALWQAILSDNASRIIAEIDWSAAAGSGR